MSKIKHPFLMEKFAEIPSISSVNLLILAASVDSRGYAAYEKMIERGIVIDQIIVFDYKKFRPTWNSDGYARYYQLASADRTQYVPCDADGDDSIFLNKFIQGNSISVFLDITSISIPDIFKICFVFKELKDFAFLNVIYSEPKYYKYLNGLYFDYEHHSGERAYRVIDEYFTSSISKDVVLICFLGFDPLISKYIHEMKEDSDIVAINGFPSFYPKLKDISLERNYELISAIGQEKVQYSQANHPFSAYNTLTEIKSNNRNKILDICVLGTKPMALGACLFALNNSSHTKVSYPYPVEYRPQISIEAADIWWYGVNLCQ